MKLSVMSYTLGRTGWFKDNKLDDLKKICKLAAEIGTDGIDWVTTHGMDPKEIRQAMAGSRFEDRLLYQRRGPESRQLRRAGCAGADTARATIETAVTLGTDKVMLVTSGKLMCRATSAGGN